MKKHWFIRFIFLSMFLFYCSSLAQEAQGPRMVLKERVFDFKEVREGEVVAHAFEVQNEGDQVLEIIRVKPG